MADAHNCLLRALNAIVLQGPHVHSSKSPSQYIPQDVKDFLFYIQSWLKSVDHHHHTEETVIFPGIEAMANEPGLLSGAESQHAEFHDGLADLLVYVTEKQARPEEYDWATVKAKIDAFAPALLRHLYEEIELVLSFRRLDSEGLQRCWDEGETAAKAAGKISFLVSPAKTCLGISIFVLHGIHPDLLSHSYSTSSFPAS